MIGQLTLGERRLALLISVSLALCGLAIAFAGRDDPLGLHGALILVAALAGVFWVISGYDAPAPVMRQCGNPCDMAAFWQASAAPGREELDMRWCVVTRSVNVLHRYCQTPFQSVRIV